MTKIPGPYLYGQYTGAAPYGPAISPERLPDIVVGPRRRKRRQGNGNPVGLVIILALGAIMFLVWDLIIALIS